MLKEFKEFALKGNMLDLAIGIIIGVAFGAVVSSLVDDIIMPPIGLFLGGVDFSQSSWFSKGEGNFNTIAQAKEDRSSHLEHWPLHQRGNQIPDCRLRSLPTGQGNQQANTQAGGEGAGSATAGGGCSAVARDPRPPEGVALPVG